MLCVCLSFSGSFPANTHIDRSPARSCTDSGKAPVSLTPEVQTRDDRSWTLLSASYGIYGGMEVYTVIHSELIERYEKADTALNAAKNGLHQKKNRDDQIKAFITEVSAMPKSIAEFSIDYFGHLVEKITVFQSKIVFTFSCGVEVEA